MLFIAGAMAPLSISVTQIAYGFIALYFIYGCTKGIHSGVLRNIYLWLALLIAFAFFVTSMLGNAPSNSFKIYKTVLLPFIIILGYYLYSPFRLRIFAAGLLTGGAVSAVMALIKYIIAYSIYKYEISASGGIDSPVSYGNVIALIIVTGVIMVVFRFYKSRKEALYYVLMTAISFLGLVVSTTRAAIVPCVIVIIFLLIRCYGKKGTAASLAILCLCVLAVYLMPGLKFKVAHTVENFRNPSNPHTSVGWRLILWKESWRVFLENPLSGVGMHNLDVYLKAIPGREDVWKFSAAHAHSNLFQLLAEHGLIGFISVNILFVRLFWEQFRRFLAKNSYALMGLCLFFVYFVVGIPEYSLFDSELCMFFFMFTGFLLRAQTSDA